jgi:hypothetical protein
MGKLGLNSGYIGSDQRTTTNGVVGYDKYYLERRAGGFNPVLDAIFVLDVYINAAAAYSLRKLSSTYLGFAVRVRRSSDNTEQNIEFSGTQLNVSELLAFCGAGDGFVTTWYDQSGNGRNATQETAANQPQIVSSGNVILENGIPTVSFTSTTKRLQTVDQSLFFSDCTISYVARSISAPSLAPLTFGYGNQSQTSQNRYLGPLNNFLAFVVFGSDYVSTISAVGDISLALYSSNYVMDSNLATVFKNNNFESGNPGTLGTVTTFAKFGINSIAGRNESATINFSEGIFYAFDNSNNLNAIRSNQSLHYNI